MTGLSPDEYMMLRRIIEEQTGISAELPLSEAFEEMDDYQRKQADKRWKSGKCECCVGCPEQDVCEHTRGDFPAMRPLKAYMTKKGR